MELHALDLFQVDQLRFDLDKGFQETFTFEGFSDQDDPGPKIASL